MKKVLFLGVLSLLFVSLFSCNDDDDDNGGSNNLAVETKRLKVEAVGNQSLFDPVKFKLNIPIGSTIEDETFGSVKYDIDSAAFFHRNDTGAVTRVAGTFDIISSETLEFKTSTRLFLDESYYFYIYCSYYKAGSSERIKENGSNAVIARWAKYVPTVVAGEDVIFSSTMNGSETNIINPYSGDMIVDFKVPVLFDAEGAASSDIALLYRSMTVTSNSASEYIEWTRDDDTANLVFNYMPVFPEDKQNMIGGVYYTVNLQFDYLVNENGHWKQMMDSYGDTAIWNFNKDFKTDELFVPKDIVTGAFPAEGDVRIDTIPTFYISESHLNEIESNGISFRPVLKMFEVTDGKRTYSEYKWLKKDESSASTADSVVIKLDLDSMLLPSTTYDIAFETNWQFKKDTAWFDIIEEDTIKREVFNIEVETTNPAPGKQTFVSLTPSGDDVHMNVEVKSEILSAIGENIVVDGIEMRPKVESFKLIEGTNLVSESYDVADDNKTITLVLDSLLIPTTDYSAIVLAYWEYKDINDSWKRVTQNAGSYYVEGDTTTFTTFGVPGTIVKGIAPTTSRANLDDIFEVNLIGANMEDIEKEGILFRPVFLADEFSVTKGTSQEVAGTAGFNASNDVYSLDADSMLYADATYTVSTKAYWEFKDGDTWKAVTTAGSVRYETIAKAIKTVTSPASIVKSIQPNRSGSLLNDTISVTLSYNHDEEIEFGGTKFKLILNDPIVTENLSQDTVQGSYGWNGDDVRTFVPSEYLQTATTYTTSVDGYWMYLRDGKWFTVADEDRTVEFSTVNVPGALVSTVVPAKGTVPVDSLPLITMGGTEIQLANNISFKRVIDELKLMKGDEVVDSVFTYAAKEVTFDNVSELEAATDYTVVLKAHWEFKKADDSWAIANKADGTENRTTRTVNFSTEQ